MKAAADRPFHLHVGLGRLGMGLVLELIRPDVPLIILQRGNGSSKKWLEQLKARLSVTLKNSICKDKRLVPYRLCRQTTVRVLDGNSRAIREEIHQSSGESFLLIYEHLTDINWVTNYCATMSASIKEEGWNEFEPWLEHSAEAGGMKIFPFENGVVVNSPRNQVIPVTPDRICAKDITFNERLSTLDIEVENFAHIVINAPEHEWQQLFSIRREEVTAAESAVLFEYYSHRKRFLVNGLHYYLATFGYGRLLEIGVPDADWRAQYLPIVIEYVLSDAGKAQHAVDVLIGAQAMRLMVELESRCPTDTELEQVFSGRSTEQVYLSLCDYGVSSIARFKKITDPLDRILKLDNYAKFTEKTEAFVNDLLRFQATYEGGIDQFPARLKPWRADLGNVLSELTQLEHKVWANYFDALRPRAK